MEPGCWGSPGVPAAHPPSPQTCLVCRRGDDDEHLLLCDGCDRGCHLYCHRPKMTEVPEGDWFCSVCVSRVGYGAAPTPQTTYERGPPALISSLPAGRAAPGPRHPPARQEAEMGASVWGEPGGGGDPAAPPGLAPPRGAAGAAGRGRGAVPPQAPGRRAAEPAQRPDLLRVSGAWGARGRPGGLALTPRDLPAPPRIILMEMESHEDAWPFLEPVNPRLVPGYRKVIKNPMDFATMRTRLLRGG